MCKSSMNTYIYAPKDDTKHRALWRQLYTKEEERKLKILIDAASTQNVTFVYAISPGLDISFANPLDVTALKKKMKQVNKLGCKAFALLFDDIMPILKPSDAAVYESSAHAQASLTNELYTYLKKPQFLFCPTEYCKTRAVPNVQTSNYLNTLGSELYKEIDIMWTGDKVIPEIITKDSIQELGEVLQRKPVIWDNIHANDYDQRRVYLGAYCGRPIELYPYLNGILTNPNCEFEANFVAIHTLGTWYRVASSTYNQDESFDVQMEDLSDDDDQPVSSDECDMSDDSLPPLTAADVTSVVSEYSPKEALKLAISDWLNEFNTDKKAPLKTYSKRNLKTMVVNGQTVLSAVPYDLDNISEDTINSMMEDKIKPMFLTDDHIMLLTDLFCLPYEHGSQGNRILYEFGWLIENVTDIYEQPPSKEKVSCWFDKLLKCDEHCQDIYKLFEKFCKIPNEAILYDLYPYLWDLKEVVLALETFVHWLSDTMTTQLSIDILNVIRPVLNPSFQNILIMNDFTEPWHIKYLGGLTVALHKLLPFRGGYMFLDNAPGTPSNNMIRTRTYSHPDKDGLYKFCVSNSAFKDNIDDPKTSKHGDLEVGSYISVCSETFLLIESAGVICGYIAAVPDNQRYVEKTRTNWLPTMKEKYVDFNIEGLGLTNVEGWNQPTSSHLVLKLNQPVYEQCFRRILSSALSILKASGAVTVFHEIHDNIDLDMYRKLGFFPVNEDPHQKILWRNL